MSEISRRATLAWVAAAAAWANGSAQAAPIPKPGTFTPAWPHPDMPPIQAAGYGSDPDLVHPSVPWPLTLAASQRAMLKTIAGLVIPADARSPSAASLPIDAFIDEWISAPYPQQQQDRAEILAGLAWLDDEAKARSGTGFDAATDAQRRAIFDDIAWRDKIKPGCETAAAFFARLRGLMMTGFYSLPAGMKDIGYQGNRPSLSWPGPPADALAHLNAGLAHLGLPPEKP